ncbi:MAG: C1 family peptidase [Bacteroidota bacterium]
MKNLTTLMWLALSVSVQTNAQPLRQKGHFTEPPKTCGKHQSLEDNPSITGHRAPEGLLSKGFKADVKDMRIPEIGDFSTIWTNSPVSQNATGTCWAYSGISFFETESFRNTGKKVKLSEMFLVYWEYLEKAKYFLEKRGDAHLDEGSECNAVSRILRKYGALPQEAYSGLLPGKNEHNHSQMLNEIKSYLKSLIEKGQWDEAQALDEVKQILHRHMGQPPEKILFNQKFITPVEYMQDALNLNPDNYICIMSLIQSPYWEKGEYPVADNWWHSKEYYNLPLDVFMMIAKRALRAGYSFCLGGDVSEPGFNASNNVAFVPTFDIPSDYIDEHARQLRFFNKTTNDEHGMHVVGYQEFQGKDWFLLKDSGAGSRNCKKSSNLYGYLIMHEDYIKLKMMDMMVHKDMLKDYLPKFEN